MAAAQQRQKSIFITGAGSGIGRATAHYFAARGWFVGLSDIDAGGLAETAAAIPEGRRLSHTLDVRDREQWARAVKAFGEATAMRMDALFNNAGVGRGGRFEDVDPAENDLVVDVNLKGVINGAYTALPLLRATPGACIVNTGSVAGLYGAPRLAVYSATKFAVRGLTEALNLEFESYGVRVAHVAPWFLDTPILDARPAGGGNRTLRDDLKKRRVPIYPVSDAAEQVWRAVHGKGLHYMVGAAARRAHFAARYFPALMRAQLGKLGNGA